MLEVNRVTREIRVNEAQGWVVNEFNGLAGKKADQETVV
jgi:hypothetical protein